MNSFAEAVTETDSGVRIALDVSAGAKKNAFPAGYNEWRKSIRCQIAAPAVGGKANRAIIALVAETLSVPRTSVTIASGAASSTKTLLIAGLQRPTVLAALESAEKQ